MIPSTVQAEIDANPRLVEAIGALTAEQKARYQNDYLNDRLSRFDGDIHERRCFLMSIFDTPRYRLALYEIGDEYFSGMISTQKGKLNLLEEYFECWGCDPDLSREEWDALRYFRSRVLYYLCGGTL